MKFKLITFLICLLSTVNAFSQSHSKEIGFQTDDDSYLLQGSDRYYTDGTFFYYRQALKIKAKDSASLRNKVLGFEIGQKLFTPQSGSIANSNGVDQPGRV